MSREIKHVSNLPAYVGATSSLVGGTCVAAYMVNKRATLTDTTDKVLLGTTLATHCLNLVTNIYGVYDNRRTSSHNMSLETIRPRQ